MRVEADAFLFGGQTWPNPNLASSVRELAGGSSRLFDDFIRRAAVQYLSGYVGGLMYLSYLEPQICSRYSPSLYTPPDFIPVHDCLISLNRLRAVANGCYAGPYCFQND